MKAPVAAFFFAFLAAGSMGPGPARADAPPPGFTALFNGKDLAGWWGLSTEDPRKWMALPPAELKKKHDASLKDIAKHWRVENGELVNDGHGLYLTTDKDFGDFELLDRLQDRGQGRQRHLPQGNAAGADLGLHQGRRQVGPGADKGSGGLWNNSAGAPGKDPLVLADKPFGQWNQFRIIQCGSRTWVWLNDKLVVDGAILENYFDKTRQTPIVPAGPIQLQTHGGEIRWRNIFLREIPGRRGQPAAPRHRPGGLQADLQRQETSTAGPDRSTTTKSSDGAIVLQAEEGRHDLHQGGVRQLRRAPGVQAAPRRQQRPGHPLPGHGRRLGYDGMCELQVLDDNYEKVRDKIDPRQAHGSAYGMVPAARGYQRPIGQWNYQEVTVNGPTIKVELNGTVILDCDLSKVKETMGGTAASRARTAPRAVSASPATAIR